METRLTNAFEGRYAIERELGQGGMATVYLAHDLRHDRRVAIKVLREALAATLGPGRFLIEIKTTAKLQHPHILPLLDSGAASGLLYYVMPFVEGQSLRERLVKTGALPIDEAVRITREVADALAYSHQRGVVHRDIKPENIMLSSGHALVMDFGVAKAVSDAASASELTGTSIAIGTPAYMAPEQAAGEATLDHRADIYALGLTAYELLAGRAAFVGANQRQLLAAQLTQRPDPLSVYRTTVPSALEAVIMRCLEKNPADRWQSAQDLLRALDAVGTPASVTAAATLPSGPDAAAASRTRRRTTLIATGALAAFVIVAAATAWFARAGRGGTLIGDNVLVQNDVVLVSEFENRTSDPTLAATVTDAIRVELQQSRAVQVMSHAAMFAGLTRMGFEPGTFLPEPKVQELAEREGAKAYVVGDIGRVGGGYQITARVVATNGGSDALSALATASDSTKLIDAVQDVARKLRRRIGESLGAVVSAPPLAQVTTASLPALRAYSAALRAEADGQRDRAIALHKEALAIDTAFASAWGGLYVTYSNLGYVQLAKQAAERGYALRHRLAEAERLRIEARYHNIHGDQVAEEAAWARLVDMGRDHISYSNMLLGMGRFAEAEAMARRGIAVNATAPIAYWNLAEAQVAQLRFAAADSTAVISVANLPENNYRFFIPLAVRWGRRDLDAVEAYLNSPEAVGLPEPRAAADRCLLELHRGRLRAWQKCRVQEQPVYLQPLLMLAEFRMNRDTVRAHAGYETFLASTPAQRNQDRYGLLIALLAEVGHVREAEQLLNEWRVRTGPDDPGFRADSALALGAIAAAQAQWDRAVAAYLAWNKAPVASAIHIYNRGLPEAAAILARLGQADSAVVLFERALATSSTYGGSFYEAGWYAQALLLLGELYEARGDRARAGDYYRQYIERLAAADPPLAAQVAAVRQRLARMSEDPQRSGRGS